MDINEILQNELTYVRSGIYVNLSVKQNINIDVVAVGGTFRKCLLIITVILKTKIRFTLVTSDNKQ